MSTRPSLGVSGATRVPPSTAGTSSGGGDLLFGTDTEFGGIPSPMRTAGGGGGGGGSAGAAAGGADPLLEFSNDLDYGRRVGAQGAQLDATRYLFVLVRVCCQSSCLAWPAGQSVLLALAPAFFSASLPSLPCLVRLVCLCGCSLCFCLFFASSAFVSLPVLRRACAWSGACLWQKPAASLGGLLSLLIVCVCLVCFVDRQG